MQDRFVGDFGDFVKYGLLRALSRGRRLGVAWYLRPNNDDPFANYIDYLNDRDNWRHLDENLFDGLERIVNGEQRCIHAIETSGLLPEARFASEMLRFDTRSNIERSAWRRGWFGRVIEQLQGCEIVFADPDMNIWPDDRFGYARAARDWAHIPLAEAQQLAWGRTGVFYYHHPHVNHAADIQDWMNRLNGCTGAFYCNQFGFRTFFVVTDDPVIRHRLDQFGQLWQQVGELIWNNNP